MAVAVSARAEKRKAEALEKKFVILGQQEIPVRNIFPNPLNPRPSFHFGEDNPEILALGDSIKADGLHNPLKVYEIPEAPGNFRVLQGHRRLSGSSVCGVMSLECIVVRPPLNMQEELQMLGSEDAYKLDWGMLFKLKYAWDLAMQCGLDQATHPEIQAKTGLTVKQLRQADKLFKLEPALLGLVKEYEQAKYESLRTGERKKGRIANMAKINMVEFSLEKAVLVWDLFGALREFYPLVVREYSDLELQQSLAKLMVNSTVDDGESFLTQIKNTGTTPRPGVLTRIQAMLEAPEQRGRVKEFLKGTGGGQITRYAKFVRQISLLDVQVQAMSRHVNDIGKDPQTLAEGNMALLSLLRHADTLQQRLEKVMKESIRAS